MMFFFPLCIQVGNTDNPCRCKIIGPTFAFVCFILAALLCWPAALIIWPCNRKGANSCFGRSRDVHKSALTTVAGRPSIKASRALAALPCMSSSANRCPLGTAWTHSGIKISYTNVCDLLVCKISAALMKKQLSKFSDKT